MNLHFQSSPSAPLLADCVDIDFSLAIHNRTGKYFIGRDILETEELPIGDVYYWSRRSNEPLSGLVGRIVGRLQLYHIRGHAMGGPMRLLPRRNSRRPLLHLDPFTVPSTVLRRTDAVLCHDLGPLTRPELFDPEVCRIYRPIYDEISQVGPHVVFVSDSSRQQFCSLYPNASLASTRVIYNAIRSSATQSVPSPIPGVCQPFLLTVGSIGRRKNQLRCIEAFALSGLADAGVNYVLCGPREPGFEEVEAAAKRAPSVILLPYVSDAQLTWLYHEASGFVLMSLLEGFGMPVAEAIACNLVPLISRSSVLEEVAGAGSLAADPENVAEIAEAMIRLASMSDEERNTRRGQMRPAMARFDLQTIRKQWRIAFEEILAFSRG